LGGSAESARNARTAATYEVAGRIEATLRISLDGSTPELMIDPVFRALLIRGEVNFASAET
jgi:hypothetical protein